MLATIALAVVITFLSGCGAPSESPSTSTATPPEVQPIRVLATQLNAPWAIVPLRSGSTLISERDTGNILELSPSGMIHNVLTIDEAVASGEGGLLGMTIAGVQEEWLYIYYTAEHDNRVVRYSLTGEPEDYRLDSAQPILTGIPKAGNHNGGRIAIGPDNMLYIATGDASNRDASQDLTQLAGKILRLTLDGAVPADNPYPSSPVWSYGHRNVQGITWTPDGRMWASEFGQNTWDELNLIESGGNYGWPVVEGITDDARFRNPMVQWPTSEASPSGIAAVGDLIFIASLRGSQIWTVDTALLDTEKSVLYSDEAEAIWSLTADYGRIRDVVSGPERSVWFITNNTDGRGNPGQTDDRLVEMRIP